MAKLFAVFKVVTATALGLSGFAFVILLALRFFMRDSLPHRAMEWLFAPVLVTMAVVVTGGMALLLYGAWRKMSAEHPFRPLADQGQTRFLVEVPSSRQYGVLDVQADSVKGVLIGQTGGRALTVTPVAHELARVADGRVPYPEPEHAGTIMDEFFRGH